MPRLTFRDGDRDVADHVAILMRDLDTYKLTYDQAVSAMNNLMLRKAIDKHFADFQSEHMRQFSKG
jgi:hypothetical protein